MLHLEHKLLRQFGLYPLGKCFWRLCRKFYLWPSNIFSLLKKIGYIAFLSIMLLQSGGLLLIYQMQQFWVRREMLQTIEKKESGFLKLNLTVAEYQHSKINAHEISLNGDMYDVKSITYTGDKLELLVIQDLKEQSIVEKIRNSGGRKNHRSKRQRLLVMKRLLLFSPPPPAVQQLCLAAVKQKITITWLWEIFISHKSDIPSPPPRWV